MKNKIKNILYVGCLTLAVATTYFIGENKGIDKGYELGKRNTERKLERISNLYKEDCKRQIEINNKFKLWFHDIDEKEKLDALSKSSLDEINTIESLIQSVKSER